MSAEQHAQFLAEIENDIARLERELEDLRAVARWHAARAGKAASKISPETAKEQKEEPRAQTDRFANVRQIEAAEAVLREAEGPLRTGEIVSRMVNDGYSAKDPSRTKMSLFTSMTRKDSKFRKVGPGLWSLVVTDSGQDGQE